jgi:hypothetical protein
LYIVDANGVHVDPTKIQVFCDWPALTTLTELQIFLGLANFYPIFVLGFSHIIWALNQIPKGGFKAKFLWGRSQNKAFNILKYRLCLAPILSLCDLQQPFDIETYASYYVVGSILTRKVIQWPIIVRHSQIPSVSTPPMKKKCIPSYNLVANGIITF